MEKIVKFEEKIILISISLENIMIFILGKNIYFIDGMRFSNYRLENLVKNCPEDKLKYFC